MWRERKATDVPGWAWAETVTTFTPTDKPATVTDPLGRTTTTLYDALDRPERVTDPLGRVSTTRYDAAGQVLEERRAVGTPLEQATARYRYFADGQIDGITDPRNYVLGHVYDGHGRLARLEYPDGKVETYGGACPGLDPGTPTTTGCASCSATGRRASPATTP